MSEPALVPVQDGSYKVRCIIKIDRTWTQSLADVTEEEARAEGHPNLESFLTAFSMLYPWIHPEDEIRAYEFHVVKVISHPAQSLVKKEIARLERG